MSLEIRRVNSNHIPGGTPFDERELSSSLYDDARPPYTISLALI
jgi:hypothetical protein